MSSITDIQKAATIIQQDGVISYPTESVFGLGCDPLSKVAVNRILKLKSRGQDKGLIIIAGTLSQLEIYIDITTKQKHKILSVTQPTTWLVKKSNKTPNWVSGQHSKIAIRISQHPLVVRLCEQTNSAIISTSANPTGEKPALSSQQSQHYFLNQIDMYLEDATEISGCPTPIIDIETGDIIR
ncbi:Threonylcarbamoyl-AMP synthase [hydrothermal vent metagenome]|uniref:L-threonylcarbamoyladenylate synthase n=1 Tax=hydrothermal vent metagenome TaxID=652676 RepID=A0A3B0WNC4_9ZZZZ